MSGENGAEVPPSVIEKDSNIPRVESISPHPIDFLPEERVSALAEKVEGFDISSYKGQPFRSKEFCEEFDEFMHTALTSQADGKDNSLDFHMPRVEELIVPKKMSLFASLNPNAKPELLQTQADRIASRARDILYLQALLDHPNIQANPDSRLKLVQMMIILANEPKLSSEIPAAAVLQVLNSEQIRVLILKLLAQSIQGKSRSSHSNIIRLGGVFDRVVLNPEEKEITQIVVSSPNHQPDGKFIEQAYAQLQGATGLRENTMQQEREAQIAQLRNSLAQRELGEWRVMSSHLMKLLEVAVLDRLREAGYVTLGDVFDAKAKGTLDPAIIREIEGYLLTSSSDLEVWKSVGKSVVLSVPKAADKKVPETTIVNSVKGDPSQEEAM